MNVSIWGVSIAVSLVCVAVLIRYILLCFEIRNIDKRVVFITGCDTGFGNQLARSLDSRGVTVFAGCLTTKGSEELDKVTSGRLKTVPLDVTIEESVLNAFNFVSEALAGNGLWGLVNNAGIMPSYAPAEWLSVKDFEKCCQVNLFGTISVTLTFLPLLRKARGRLVSVCSVTSDCGIPAVSDYSVSKAGCKMFITCLRRELFNTGVSTHTIEPGGFATNITSKDRLMQLYCEAYRKVSPELQEYYGGWISDYVVKGIENTEKYVNTDTSMVVNAMLHALLARFPKQQYLVGWDANGLFRFIQYIPPWLADYVFGYPRPYGPRYMDELLKRD